LIKLLAAPSTWQHPVPILGAWSLITSVYLAFGNNLYTLLGNSDEKRENMWQGKEDRLSTEKLKG
jgi:hypothetical protein